MRRRGRRGRAQFENAQSAADPVESAVEHVRALAEHDARRLLGARRADQRHRRDQLRSRVPGQVRLPGHLHRLPHHRHRRTRPTRSRSSTTRAAPPARATSSSTGTSSSARGTRRSAPAAPRPRPAAARSSGQGFEGVHIFDISDPANPVMVDVDKPDNGKQGLRLAATGNPAGSPTGCGSHTATAVPDAARGYLYIYNGGSSGTCTGSTIVKIKLPTRPTRDRCTGRARRASATTTPCCSTAATSYASAPAATASRCSSST